MKPGRNQLIRLTIFASFFPIVRDFNCSLINSASLHVISVISASAIVVAGDVVSMSNTVADLS